MRLSRRQKKVVEDARQAVLESANKPRRTVRKRKPRAEKGSVIPNNVWIDDPVQGCVYVTEGKVLGVDVNLETGQVRQIIWTWKEYQERLASQRGS